MSAACNTCGNLGRACGECVITVVPGEQNTHWVPMPARPFHTAAVALVVAAERNEADSLDSKGRA
jgi:hypothetical protein